MAIFNFDPSLVQNRFDPVPVGEYVVQVTDITELTSKLGNRYLNFKFVILEGAFKNRVIFKSFNIYHSNDYARQISLQELCSLCSALGYTEASSVDTQELLNRPMRVLVRIRETEGYEPRNTITAFGAYSGNKASSLSKQSTTESEDDYSTSPPMDEDIPDIEPSDIPF